MLLGPVGCVPIGSAGWRREITEGTEGTDDVDDVDGVDVVVGVDGVEDVEALEGVAAMEDEEVRGVFGPGAATVGLSAVATEENEAARSNSAVRHGVRRDAMASQGWVMPKRRRAILGRHGRQNQRMIC